MRRILKTQLASMGVKDVLEAADGREALEKMEAEGGVDQVLLDWNMPVMDGMAFLKKIRENQKHHNVKIIMCTSESEKGRVLEALKAGANSYIVKPFEAGALKEKLGI